MTIALPAPEKGTVLDKTAFHKENASHAVAEALVFLKKSWDLSDEQVASFAGRVPVESPGLLTPVTETILHLIALHRSLFAMFSVPERQKAWLETRHPVLGEVPADIMRRSVEGLIYVRRYLDYARGRGA